MKIRTNISIDKHLKDIAVKYYQTHGGNLSSIIHHALKEYFLKRQVKTEKPRSHYHVWLGDIEKMPAQVDERNVLWKKVKL